MLTGMTNFRLNIRTGPGTNHARITTLAVGSEFAVLSQLDDWLHIRTGDGLEGFVAARFVLLRPDAAAEPPPDPDVQRRVEAAQSEIKRLQQQIDTLLHKSAEPAATTDPTEPPVGTLKVSPAVPLLNIRAEPRVAPSNLVGQLRNSDEAAALEPDEQVREKVGSQAGENRWLRLRLPDGKIGYAAAWLLRLVRPADERAITDDGQRNITIATDDANTLYEYIASFPPDRYELPAVYHDFWALRDHIGLPDPFDVAPTKPDTYDFKTLQVNGFGPNTFAYHHWQAFYRNVSGMHNGFDHIVPTGTPILALSDGIIVGTARDWPFMGSRFEKTLTLWCFLPERFRDARGRRMLSNVLVAYGHLSNNTLVRRHDVVRAGQVIGLSGHPINPGRDGTPVHQTNNAHLHWEVHLLSGDNSFPSRALLRDYDRPQPFANSTPLNPILLFSERLAQYHLHQGRKIGYAGGPTYPNPLQLARVGLEAWPPLDFFSVGQYRYSRAVIWGMSRLPWTNDIFAGADLVERMRTQYTPFEPYPMDFLS